MEHEDKLVNEKIDLLARNHSELRGRVDSLSQTVSEHTVIINKMSQTQTDVREMLDVFVSVRGGMQVLGWLGMVAKWLWPVIAVGIAITVFMRTGKWDLKA